MITTVAPNWLLAAEMTNFWRRGWGTYPVTCLMCNHEFVAVAAVGTICRTECPRCGNDWEQMWPGGAGEMPNDGVWL